jgi:exodeoxyribonuclease-5
MTDLSAQQLAGIDKIRAWYERPRPDFDYDSVSESPVFRLFGYAGTGKTTMAKSIPGALGLRNVVYGTYTGKAAHVLRSKGASPVSTIHSAIYLPTTSREARHALDAARQELGDLTAVFEPDIPLVPEQKARIKELEAALPALEAAARQVGWELNPESEWAYADLIILDEVSMVNGELARDVESFGVPVLVLGDPAQLPPVEGGGYYINAEPDHLLTEIHRSALDNPITALATRIRESTGPALGLTPDDKIGWSVRHAMQHDQVLVWTNKRRWSLINGIRKVKGFPAGVPVAGDRVMCLTNNRDLAVFNGQQFDVLASRDGALGPTLTLKDEEGVTRDIPVYSDGFLGMDLQVQAKNSGAGRSGGRMLATFADAITVHKAQGSEWPSVYVVDETAGMIRMGDKKGAGQGTEDARKWLYTAATRARQTLTIAGRQA